MNHDRVNCPDCVGGRYTDKDEGGAYCSTCGDRAPMTEQQIIETLATKVMGWKENKLYLTGSGWDTWSFPKGGFVLKTNWNPLKNMSDAWMIVDRFKNEPDAYIRFTFESHIPPLICAIDPAVICEAAKRTIKAIELRA